MAGIHSHLECATGKQWASEFREPQGLAAWWPMRDWLYGLAWALMNLHAHQ
jgi:hypothetical protein